MKTLKNNTLQLTIVRGLTGAVKTTYAKSLDAKLVEVNQFFVDKNDVYQYDNAVIKEAHNWCKLETKRLLRAGFDVVYDLNSFVSKLKNFICHHTFLYLI